VPEPSPAEAQNPNAVVDQINDCPEYVFCHEEWQACHCIMNERGDHAAMEADFDGDQQPDLRIAYVYDESGNLLRWENDRGADGIIEMLCTFHPVCPPPHPNETCQCFGEPREVTQEYLEQRLEEAGEAAQPIDPQEAQELLDALDRANSEEH